MSLWGKLKDLLSGADAAEDTACPRPETPVLVIGDVHGRADLLDRLLSRIDHWAAEQGIADPHMVFVGDYVDRGDDAARVLERVSALSMEQPERVTCLMGNHERMMLDAVDDPGERGARWLRYGGLQTLASYRIGGLTATSGAEVIEEAVTRLRAALPDGLEDWLHALPLRWQSGDVHVVHAAAAPALKMDAQPEDVLLWGHDDFLKRPRKDGLWVVHGHTIVDEPQIVRRRIAVDTGAYYSGVLTAAALMPDRPVQFLSTGPGGA